MKKAIQNMFNQNAKTYDEQYDKTKALKNALHLCIRAIMTDLPEDAHVLCIGAGTGQELLYLAEEFPAWKFTVVEPAGEMLAICRHKAELNGIVSRCTFHEGYIETLPKTVLYHAATSLLVSQFLVENKERQEFFSEIAMRLQSDGILISADLAADMSASDFKQLFTYWCNLLDIPPEKAASLQDQWENYVAVVPVNEVEKLITSGGFQNPVHFYQTFFIHGWYAKL